LKELDRYIRQDGTRPLKELDRYIRQEGQDLEGAGYRTSDRWNKTLVGAE
jgi:hypothetical protein